MTNDRRATPEDTFELVIGNDEESLAAFANLHRGLIVANYAHVEFVLTDFVVRCSNVVEYGSVMPDSLPWSIEKRLKLVRTIFTTIGPFFQYQPEMLPLIDRLLSFESLRHMMVHGLMVYHYNPTEMIESKIVFTRYDFGPKKTLIFYKAEFTAQSLGERQLEVSRYAKDVIQRLVGILEKTNLPPPPIDFPST